MRSNSVAVAGYMAVALTLGRPSLGHSQCVQSTIGGIKILANPSDSVPLKDLEQNILLLRQDIEKKKVAILGQAMAFTPEQAAKFWPIYAAYTAELHELSDFRLKIVHDYVASFNSMDDQTADGLAQRLIHFYTKRIALQQRYYGVVKQQLGAKLAARFVQVESRLVAARDLQIGAQVPLLQ